MHSKTLKSIFNRLLACLAVFDNLFIALSLLEAYRRHLGVSNLHTYAFCYFLYPVQNIILCCNIYLPVALALERFRAIRHPVEYHNSNTGRNPWPRVLYSYILPVLVFSVAICLPKFFESTVALDWTLITRFDPATNATIQDNVTVAHIQFTPLRFNADYVLWYINVTRLCVTGMLPFLALVLFNANIYTVIRRRRHMNSRLQNPQSAALKREAAQQSHVLFVICGLFFATHVLRVGLAVHELIVLEHYRRSLGLGHSCHAVKFWTLITASVSQLLLSLNSSVNFAIYCLMSKDFRHVLFNKLKKMGLSDDPGTNNSSNMGSNSAIGVTANEVSRGPGITCTMIQGSICNACGKAFSEHNCHNMEKEIGDEPLKSTEHDDDDSTSSRKTLFIEMSVAQTTVTSKSFETLQNGKSVQTRSTKSIDYLLPATNHLSALQQSSDELIKERRLSDPVELSSGDHHNPPYLICSQQRRNNNNCDVGMVSLNIKTDKGGSTGSRISLPLSPHFQIDGHDGSLEAFV